MSAEQGWIGQSQSQRTSIPGEERKWRIMMGNGQFLTDEDKDRLSKIRAKAIRQASRRHVEEVQAAQVASDAVRVWPTGPGLKIADRYAAGRPRRS